LVVLLRHVTKRGVSAKAEKKNAAAALPQRRELVISAEAEIQSSEPDWVPACARTTQSAVP
jgi:hypothetical protein